MMARKVVADAQRHSSTESSGAESWRSQDTVKGGFHAANVTPKKIRTDRRAALEKEMEISPHTVVSPQSQRSDVAPWETPTNNLDEYRKDISPMHRPSTAVPAIAHQSSSATLITSPWLKETLPQYGRHNRPSQLPSSIFGANYYDSGDEMQLSPGYQASTAGDYSEDRRPSVASVTTMSSTGSRPSISGMHSKYKKKLQGFFGEDLPGNENRNGSDASITTPGVDDVRRERQASAARPISPTSSRPRTPVPGPSSEVTPWMFQDSKDAPAVPPEQPSSDSTSGRTHNHRLHLTKSRTTRAGGDSKDSTVDRNNPSRPPVPNREPSIAGPARVRTEQGSVGSIATLRPRAPSPSGSLSSVQSSAQTRDAMVHRSPAQNGSGKRSLFDRVTGRHKQDKTDGALKSLPVSTGTLSSQQLRATPSKVDLPPQKVRKGTLVPDGKQYPPSSGQMPSKRDLARKPFKSAKRSDPSSELRIARDPNANMPEAVRNASALWHLDTDMTSMEGIIDRGPMTPPVHTDVYAGFDWEKTDKPAVPEEAGAWDAPDSWAVKRIADANVARLRELDDSGNVAQDEDPGPLYFMRIFRADSTFAVISAGINTTSSELIQMMAKKTFLQDELDTYQMVMRKRGLSRQLDGGERPLVMQNRLLEMAGYTDSDRLDDLGREDHGYLCRFTFLPGKLSGYASLEKDPGFNKMQKFNYIDLAGRNLITIPIALYQKATEIITLNVSQNLSLDIPKDFIQSCTNLREIKYTSNEAWKLPQSICMASKLTMLDVSNNRLEQLEHADLDKLTGLISLKLSNNKLSSLPSYFGRYYAIRSLNLASNSLTEFPDFLTDLRSLVDVDISFNSISALPGIGKLVNLERLFATNNKLSGSFDPNFKDLVNLNSLDLRFNTIDNIDVMAQLPKLEHLMIGHNSISAFEGTFNRIKLLFLDHNPVTRFGLSTSVPTLSVLNIASAKLSQLPEDLFMKLPGLTKLVLDKNHFGDLSTHVGRLTKLEHLSIAKNLLTSLPAEIGRLSELRYLDVRENNLHRLPSEIWYAKRLETLNVASNVLAEFPKPGNPPAQLESSTPASTPGVQSSSPEFDELGRLEGFQMRRPSHASLGLGGAGSPASSQRKASIASTYGAGMRNPSMTLTAKSSESSLGTITPASRKDSSMSGKLAATFAMSLRTLVLADNRLSDDVFDELILLGELRVLNLSYNELYDMPSRTIKRWPHLQELFLSGNDLSSLPAEDLEEGSSLRILHLNNNKFQTLPAELGKVQKLQTLDVGSNMLKYNVSNWPYDWNWNYNQQLRYLNMSGNKRLEIKPSANAHNGRDQRDLTDFTTLTNLRTLGLMDVTLTIPSVPDQAADRRIRTAGSMIGTTIPYGMADTLGRGEHLSTLDMVIPTFRGHEDQTLVGMFDGQILPSGGSKIAKFLHEKFRHYFSEELDKIRTDKGETPGDALRRAYLGLNKDLATTATAAMEIRESPNNAVAHRGSVVGPELGEDDINSGAVATVCYLHGMELYVSNVGDAQALLIQSEGGHKVVTQKHDPAEAGERERIREAGGYVSRQGRLNDALEVSRAFGYVHMTPCVIAAPHISQIALKESDEMLLIASRELWDYLTMDFAVDVARSERGDLMRAAQKLRDLAIAFGATSKIMVMMIGVSDLRKRERARFRTHSMSMGPTGTPDDYFTTARRGKRGRETIGDSKLARLDQEVDAPQGEVSLVFTDIKNSTMLWETYPIAMRSAIKMHNEVMRRHLRIIGGYEVKTEGDAFMVAFPTVTSALLWCFTIQSALLEVQWPQEILSSVHGQEVTDADSNVIFRGLSVRMGIHWGHPVCEPDPVTKRMDYFGPMVNRAARISSVADGGQITVSSDFIAEIQRLLETHIESDRSGSTGSDDTLSDDLLSQAIRRELRSLSSQGFEVKDLGQRTLKGLENPEYIYLMYPHSLASRLVVQQQQRADAAAAEAPKSAVNPEHADSFSGGGTSAFKAADSQLTIDTDELWALWNVSLRLEMLCSALESTVQTALKPPETALLERMKERGGQITDRFLVNFVEHQISRIETCITTLLLRNMVRPFGKDMLATACPMADILGDLAAQMQELKTLKAQVDFMAPA